MKKRTIYNDGYTEGPKWIAKAIREGEVMPKDFLPVDSLVSRSNTAGKNAASAKTSRVAVGSV
ncbi:MAG: hypothetical protein Ta2A_13460 [Treponemataceae bacterium]|nr:MAG: hypothetical protein Ta2A_13460 [Treponemataceae bacterium]